MLALKSSARDSKRYLLIKGLRSSVEKAILEYIGVLGWAEASPVFVSEHADEVVVCVNREALTNVRAALALAKDNLTVLRVSGTLKGLEK
ncbi:Rpp14/Pop5 family protein [Candidatus Pacearchaeota archaeon]|nr:Rpp14/Pop5 family protein [Candidatus Pacearchaeota archaeon]